MPPRVKGTKTTKRCATTKAGPAAAVPVVQRFVLSRNARCMLDEVAEMLLFALNTGGPTRAPFVYRVEKPGSDLDGEETGVRAASREEADRIAADRAARWECRLRFVREQRGDTRIGKRT